MKTGEYLTGGKPPKGEGRSVKAPKPAKRPPSGSQTPVTPLPGPGKKRPAKPGKGPKAHIEPRPMPRRNAADGDKQIKAYGSGAGAVKSVAAASAAAKTAKPFSKKK